MSYGANMTKLPDGCPACGAGKILHEPKSSEMHEWARYRCLAELVLIEDGMIEVNDNCRDALNNAVCKLNAVSTFGDRLKPE